MLSYIKTRHLPKPENGNFDGDPLKYTSFRNNFETHIESKFRDPKILLCLLLQHCEVKVKNQIEHFSNKGIDGYGLALDRLEREYGQPWVIANACERRLQKFVNVKSNDLEKLRMFADFLEKTEVLLKQCFSTFLMSWTTFRRDLVLGPTSCKICFKTIIYSRKEVARCGGLNALLKASSFLSVTNCTEET